MASAYSDSSSMMNCDSNEGEPTFEIEEDEDCGRYLVAQRNLEQGEVILREPPTGNYRNCIRKHTLLSIELCTRLSICE